MAMAKPVKAIVAAILLVSAVSTEGGAVDIADNRLPGQLVQDRQPSYGDLVAWSTKAAIVHADLAYFFRLLNEVASTSIRVWRRKPGPEAVETNVEEITSWIGSEFLRLSDTYKGLGKAPENDPGGAAYAAYLHEGMKVALQMMLSALKGLKTAENGNFADFNESFLDRLAFHAKLLRAESKYLSQHLRSVNPAGPQYGYERGIIAGNDSLLYTILYIHALHRKPEALSADEFNREFAKENQRMENAISTGRLATKLLFSRADRLTGRNPGVAQLARELAASMDRAFTLEDEIRNANVRLAATLESATPWIADQPESWFEVIAAYQQQYLRIMVLLAERQTLNAERIASLGSAAVR